MTRYDNLGIFGIIIGFAGLAYGAWQSKKTLDVSKKLDISLTELEKNTPVDVKQSVVDEAIRRAVDREVKAAVAESSAIVKNDIHAEIEKGVRKEVDASLKTIKEEVAETISDQVANIDEYALKETVTRQAKEKILKKFDGSLDGILGDFSHQLNNVNRIYSSIADTLKGNQGSSGKEMTFRIG